MPCPKCGSSRLSVREATGFEALLLLFITKRKYRCFDCKHYFRALDRRRVPRDKVASSAKAGQAAT